MKGRKAGKAVAMFCAVAGGFGATVAIWISLGGDRFAWLSELQAAELVDEQRHAADEQRHAAFDDLLSRQMQLLSVVGADVLRLKIGRFSDEIAAIEARGLVVSPLLREQQRQYEFELGQIREQINAIMSGRGSP